MAARIAAIADTNMQLNVFRPSNGVWYYGRSFAGTGGTAMPFGIYGDLPFAPDFEGFGYAKLVVFRPTTGTWYVGFPYLSMTWGQPGDIPAPRSALAGQPPALAVYRPTTGLTYNCFTPTVSFPSAYCAGGTNVEGPSGSPGVVPLQGKWK